VVDCSLNRLCKEYYTASAQKILASMLRFDHYPGNPSLTLVMLHGLFGSAKNFASIATALTDVATVYAYDARNHGASSHTVTHTLADLTQDLADFLAEHKITQPVLMGHSMGGLTVMNFARLYPDIPQALVAVDIAPRTYAPAHALEIAAQKLDVTLFRERREIDAAMAKILPEATIRSFLQMNLARSDSGTFYWQNNIAAIENSPGRTVFPAFTPPLFTGPVLAVRGLESDFVTEADTELMKSAFPLLQLHSVPGAGHWLHHTHREALIGLVRGFLQSILKR
jgi:pimeloyl-ACP methyl ester carboxylesterase